jgi:hypothetical protein
MIPKLNMQGPREASNSVGRTIHNSLSTKSQDQISVLGEKMNIKLAFQEIILHHSGLLQQH